MISVACPSLHTNLEVSPEKRAFGCTVFAPFANLLPALCVLPSLSCTHTHTHTHTHTLAKALLDDLDKELNNYIMRCREWYGWHFPEMGKIVTDNLTYAKTVKAIGQRAVI